MSARDFAGRPVLAGHVRLQPDPVTGETVLLYPEGIIELNPTAAEILRRCDGDTSLAAIVAALAAEYDAGEDELREDVVVCLRELQARNFVVIAS